MANLVLIQKQDTSIICIDNETHIGKGRVQHEIENGGKFVGRIVDTELMPLQFKNGTEHHCRQRIDGLHDKLSEILKVIEASKDI